MKYVKAIGLGALVWVVMFALVSAVLNLYGAHQWVRIAMGVIAGILSYVAAGWLMIDTRKHGLFYGILFVVVGVVLDYIITRQFNADIFRSKSLWAGYLLVALAPMLRVRSSAPAPQTAMPQ